MEKFKNDQVGVKIEQFESIVDSVANDFCEKAQLCSIYMDNELVIFDNGSPVISISREYRNDNVIVNFFSFIETDLSNVQVMNLRSIYHDLEVLKYINVNNLKLWFHQDKDLIMEYNYATDYQNIEIFRSELLLILSKLFFAKLQVRDLLNEKFYELKSVLTN